MRTLGAILGLGLLVSACVSGPSPMDDVANYDALRSARAACAAKGGELRLRDQGDPERISSFACKRK